METHYIEVLFYSLLGGLVSLGGCLFIYFRSKKSKSIIAYATPFAAGALLAAVFLDLLSDGLSEGSTDTVLVSVLVGILLFFMGERFLEWFHHNHGEVDTNRDSSLLLIIIGNAMHNALDGVAIAASFLVNVPTGIVTTFAVALHEVPHNAADFGLLVHKKVSRNSALLITMLSNFATVLVALFAYKLGTTEKLPTGVLLGISSGFLLYIALSDIIPDIHDHASKKKIFDSQVWLLIAGVIVVGLAIRIAHHFVDI